MRGHRASQPCAAQTTARPGCEPGRAARDTDVWRMPTMTGPDREHLFGAFRLNVSTRQLWQENQEVTLPLKAFECLAYLIENRARAVSRSELFQAVWRNAHLTENVLDQTIFVLRRALDDTSPGNTHIKTVRGFGYHWVAPVESAAAVESTTASAVRAEVPSPRIEKRWWWIALLPVVAILAVALLKHAYWNTPPATANAPWKSGTAIALVLPADVVSAEGKAWIRYGAMDLVADRLRSSGLPVVPSETAIALTQRLAKQPQAEATPWLMSATGANLVLRLQAQEQATRWSVTLRSENLSSPDLTARGEASDVFDATRIAADRLALSLGLTPAPAPAAGTGIVALVQQIKAAILASQPEVASASLDGADEGSKQHPEVRFQASRLAYHQERFDDAESELRSLAEDAAVRQEPEFHARVTVGLSAFAFRRRDYPAAEAQLQSALDLIRGGNHLDQICSIASKLGLISLMRGELDRARSRLASAMLECESTGSIDNLGDAENNLGALETIAGHHDQSTVYFRKAARDFARTYSLDHELGAQSNLVEAYLEKADHAAAALVMDRIDQLLAQSGQRSKVQTASLAKANYLISGGKLSEAQQLLAHVESSISTDNEHPLALLKAQLAAASDHLVETEALAAKAVEKRGDRGILAETDTASAWLLLIRTRIALKQGSEAHDALAAMTTWVSTAHVPSVRIPWLLARAETADADGRVDEAKSAYDELLPLVDADRSNRLRSLAVDSHVRWLLSNGKGRPDLESALAVANRIATDDTFEGALVRLRIAHALGAQMEWRKALALARELAGERKIPEALLDEPTLHDPTTDGRAPRSSSIRNSSGDPKVDVRKP